MSSPLIPSLIKRFKGGPEIKLTSSGWLHDQDNRQICKGLETFFNNVNRLGLTLQRLQNALSCNKRGL
jgi:hypothetical protein